MAKSRRPFGRVFRRRNRRGKKGSTWYIRFRVGGRDVTRVVGPDRSVAVAKLAELRSKMERERVLGIKEIASATFPEFWKIAGPIAKARLTEKGYEVEDSRIKIIAAYFGAESVCDVTVARVEDFRAWLRNERKASDGSCNRYLSTLSMFFKAAVSRGFAAENPVRDVKRAREELLPVPFLAVEDLDKLVAKSPPHLQPVVVLAFETGLRRGELVALLWRDVDFGQRTVLVRKSKSKRNRSVPLTARAETVLRALAAALSPDTNHRDEHVFAEIAAKGEEQGASFVTHQFAKVVKAAEFSDISFHSLRHAFCSGLARAGVPLPTIAELAGHSQISVTYRYARHAPQGAARQAIDLLAKSRTLAAPKEQAGGVAEAEPTWGTTPRGSVVSGRAARSWSTDFMVVCDAA